MVSEEKKKRGRPTKNGTRRERIDVRLSDEEYQKLAETSKIVGKSMAEIVRNGIVMAANNEIFLHEMNREEGNF